MSEQQRVAIVTGAAGGIGRELVLGLLGKGSRSRRSTAPPRVSPISPRQRRSGSTAPI
jgi:NAD(P)-dependent dehydrogenase (short-subunit alcohol dehydrogenase family)